MWAGPTTARSSSAATPPATSWARCTTECARRASMSAGSPGRGCPRIPPAQPSLRRARNRRVVSQEADQRTAPAAASQNSRWLSALAEQLYRGRHVVLHGNVNDLVLVGGRELDFVRALVG